jgi:ligand-binding sensor domain-containing protein
MQKLAHPTAQCLLVASVLALLSLSCNQPAPTTGLDVLTSESDNTQPFVVNWQGDTILTGIPIKVKGQYYPADSFPEPKPVKGAQPPKVVPAYSNVTTLNIRPKVVQVPEVSKTITPGENGVPAPDKVPVKVTVTPVKHPKPVPALQPGISGSAQFDIQYLDTKHGMLSNQVNDILEDSRGNLWFSTKEGLSRYDGKYFTHYTMKEGLPGNWILDLYEDSKGNLWLEVRGKGIVKFDGYSFFHYNLKTSSGSATVLSVQVIQEDGSGHIWIGSVNFGLYKYLGEEDTSAQFLHYSKDHGVEGLSYLRVSARYPIFIDNKDDIWLANFDGITKFDGTSFTYFTVGEGLSNNQVEYFLQDSRERIWIANNTGIDILQYGEEGKPATITQYDLGGRIAMNLREGDHGNIWYASGNPQFGRGYLAVNESGEITHFTKFDPSIGINGKLGFSMALDSKGHIWMGTDAGGVNRIDPNSFKSHSITSSSDSFDLAIISGIAEDTPARLWFGNNTISQGSSPTISFDGDRYYLYTEREGLYDVNVRSVFKDSRGHLWLVHFPGLTRYDNRSFFHYPNDTLKASGSFWMVFEDSKKDLWFSGVSVSCARLDENGQVLEFLSFSNSPYVKGVNQIVEDKHGQLWMSTWSAGLIRFKKGSNWGEGEVTFFTENEGLALNNVQSIESDSKGNLWIGTLGGLSFLSKEELESDQPNFINFTMEDGLKSNSVHSVIEGNDNDIWISTPNEIDLFEALEYDETIDAPPKIPHYKFHSFDHLDGVYHKEFNWRAAFKDSQNRIWWGSVEGATILDLDTYSPSSGPPQNLHLLDLEINQQHIQYGNLKDTAYQNILEFGKLLSHSFDSVAPFSNYPVNLRLPHHINHLTFHFSAIDWGAPHKIQYTYKIEGLEDDWSPLQSEPKADYRNLPPGKHILKVKAIGEAQVWSDTFEYPFTIRPPWYWNIWSMVIYSFVILLFGYFLYQFLLNRRLEKEETRRLRELDEVKTRLYTNITHEFRTPLTIILGMTDKMKKDPTRWFNEGLGMIRRNGDQLLGLINQILDLRKLEAGKLNLDMVQADIIPFLQYHLNAFQSLAAERNIRLHFISEEQELWMDFAPQELGHIINNLLSNAIKYNKEGGDVYVSIAKVNERSMREAATPMEPVPLRREGWGAEVASHFLSIKIKDTGIGIPPTNSLTSSIAFTRWIRKLTVS